MFQNGPKDGGETEPKSNVKPQISLNDFNRIVAVAESLTEIDVVCRDDDEYGDDDDPDLLNELSQIIEPKEIRDVAAVDLSSTAEVPVLLQQRIEMYKTAETNATTANEDCRARRFARGLSTLETMLKDVREGKTIDMAGMPPEVTTKVKDGSDSTPIE